MSNSFKEIKLVPVNSEEVVDSYNRRLKNSPVDFERFHAITTEAACNLSPAELKALYDTVATWSDDNFNTVFNRAAPLRSLLQHGKIPEYKNIYISHNARLYRGSVSEGDKKGLIIFFGGAGLQAGAVHCRILTLLSSNNFDVLFLRRNAPSDYRNGIPGIANGMRATCESLAHNFPKENYKGVGCFGFCMGGFWALRSAMMLGADIGISVSGRISRKSGALTEYDEMIDPSIITKKSTITPRLHSIFGENTPLVGENARLLKLAYPEIQLHIIPKTKEKSLYPVMTARRQLKPFFNAFSHAVMNPEEDISWPF